MDFNLFSNRKVISAKSVFCLKTELNLVVVYNSWFSLLSSAPELFTFSEKIDKNRQPKIAPNPKL